MSILSREVPFLLGVSAFEDELLEGRGRASGSLSTPLTVFCFHLCS